MEVDVKSESTNQEKITSERIILQLQKTEYLLKLENKLVDFIRAKEQLDKLKKEVTKDQ